MQIIVKITNITSNARSRRKRNVNEKHANMEHFNENDLQKVKEIIMQHHTRCHEKEHEKVCKELMLKLKSIIRRNEDVQSTNTEVFIPNINHPDEVMSTADVAKRDAQSTGKMRGFISKGLSPVVPLDMHPENAVPHLHMGVPSKITDTCLLAKLLKRSYPNVHGKTIQK